MYLMKTVTMTAFPLRNPRMANVPFRERWNEAEPQRAARSLPNCVLRAGVRGGVTKQTAVSLMGLEGDTVALCFSYSLTHSLTRSLMHASDPDSQRPAKPAADTEAGASRGTEPATRES